MSSSFDSHSLPDSKSPELCLSHPTYEECMSIWTNTSVSWRDTLTVPLYLKESRFLTTVPLAKDGGMTNWILVDRNLAPGQRPILCSCESFRKRSLISDKDGNVADTIVHGIASVFCPPAYRGRGYASRMMTELAKVLRTWQTEHVRCVGSILYSDIGKSFYAGFGWQPTVTNTHMVFQPSEFSDQCMATKIPVKKLHELCEKDEAMIRVAMAKPIDGVTPRISVVPDIDHMLWHISKEEFACERLFGRIPHAKGAIAGPAGSRVWAIWTHRYYSNPADRVGDNTLYILRLVVETQKLSGSRSLNDERNIHRNIPSGQIEYLKAVLQAAQNEAAEWKLDQVKLWHPTLALENMIERTGVLHSVVERKETSIASGLWFEESGMEGVIPEWINNEYYAWC